MKFRVTMRPDLSGMIEVFPFKTPRGAPNLSFPITVQRTFSEWVTLVNWAGIGAQDSSETRFYSNALAFAAEVADIWNQATSAKVLLEILRAKGWWEEVTKTDESVYWNERKAAKIAAEKKRLKP